MSEPTTTHNAPVRNSDAELTDLIVDPAIEFVDKGIATTGRIHLLSTQFKNVGLLVPRPAIFDKYKN